MAKVSKVSKSDRQEHSCEDIHTCLTDSSVDFLFMSHMYKYVWIFTYAYIDTLLCMAFRVFACHRNQWHDGKRGLSER